MKALRILSIGCCVALIGAIAGCGNKTGSGSSSSKAAQKSGGKTITISMIAKSSTNPVFLSARKGAEDAARDLSKKTGTKIMIDWRTPPTEDGQVQAQRIAQAVNDGASAILLSCSDAGKVTSAVNDAVTRGVPVMTFDSDAPKSQRFAFYGADDIKTGEQLMNELISVMGTKGRVAILAGNQNATNLQKRVEGAKKVAAKYPGIQVVGTFYHIESPQDAAAEVIKDNNAYPGITGWVMVGGWPLFTKSLLNQIDPAKMKIVAIDALPAQLPYIEKGIAPVLLAQPTYKWGYVSVEKIVDKLVLKKIVPQNNPMELVRVSNSNLGPWSRQLKDWGFADVPEKYLKLK